MRELYVVEHEIKFSYLIDVFLSERPASFRSRLDAPWRARHPSV